MSSYQATLRKRVKKLQKRSKAPSALAETSVSLRRKIADEPGGLIGLLTKPLPDMKSLDEKLQRAQIETPSKVFLLRGLFVALACTGAAIALDKPFWMGLGPGLTVGILFPLKYVNMKIEKKMKVFLSIFPDAIDLIVRGLRSGLPVTESMKMVGNEVPEPVGGVFRNLISTMELGVSMDKALQDTASAMQNTEFNFFATSIIIQRETGGNLGEILSNLSDVLRKRHMMQMKIKAMTSEARASAWIVGSLPVIVSIAVNLLSPGYQDVLIDDYRGNIALGTAVGMLVGGVWLMGRMAKFEM